MAVHEVVELLIVVFAAGLGYLAGPSLAILPNPAIPSSAVNLAPFIFSLMLGLLVWIVIDTAIAFDKDRSAIRAPKFLGGGTIHLIFIPALVAAYSYGMYLHTLSGQGSLIGFQNGAFDLLRFFGFAWNLLVTNTGVTLAGVFFGVLFAMLLDTSMK